ncbi:T9SS type A sorting domain-containing protein [Flavobacterium sp.]|uniref:T9SS type A sorting domain-containing protein n=1 Tax=Flavobacterium sp. TaxID=239 RepID=UPI003340623B
MRLIYIIMQCSFRQRYWLALLLMTVCTSLEAQNREDKSPQETSETFFLASDGTSTNPITFTTAGQLTSPAGTVYNVLNNDRRITNGPFCNSNPPPTVPLAMSSITLTSTSSSPFFSIDNSNGNLLASGGFNGIPLGNYTLTYTVCDLTFPSICRTTQVNVRVVAPSPRLSQPEATKTAPQVASTATPSCDCSPIICFNDLNLKNRLLTDLSTCFNLTFSSYIPVDANGDGEISMAEAALVGGMNLNYFFGPKYTDLTGLNCFPNLKSLLLGDHLITTFNLPQQFETLNLQGNSINSLNIGYYSNLKGINLSNTPLNTINLENCPLLEGLSIGNSPNLTYLNLKNGSSLNYTSIEMTSFCWNNFPNLTTICVDDFELPALQNYLFGCNVPTSTIAFPANCGLDTSAFESSSLLRVSPNPSSGIFYLHTSLALDTRMIHVYNSLGQKVYQTSLSPLAAGESIPIDLSAQPTGIFYITLYTETASYALKVSKQ